MPFLKHLFAGLTFALPLVLAQKDNLGLKHGYIDIETNNFKARIARDAQVLVSLTSKDDTFDFLPFDLIDLRANNGQYHWGDITYRYRNQGVSKWTHGDSAHKRHPVKNLTTETALASADLGPTLPKSPLNITREWLDFQGDLALRFTITNNGGDTIELGSLGFPAELNSIFTNKTDEEIQTLCSLADPYIGMDAGHIRIAPIRGTGNGLVVTPLKGTETPLEAYRDLDEPWFESTDYGSQTFEGFYEWQVFTKAWAENEWKNQEPWNIPTSKMLKPGESLKVGVRFSISESIRDFDNTINNTGTPVVVGVPGYIIPRDLPALLFPLSNGGIASIDVSPKGALEIAEAGGHSREEYKLTPSPSAWGRVRVAIKYNDGRLQTVHYFVTKPTSETLNDLGSFLTTKAWFNTSSDLFKRSPSVMTYDCEKRAIVEQESRVWIAGLSDEGGTGAYVAAMLKQVLQPDAEEIAKLDEFLQTTIWGRIQGKDYGVRKSLFYYDPKLDYPYNKKSVWTSWMSWDKKASEAVDRAYDYVHVTVAYWSMYRVSRAYPELTTKSWSWYLDQAQKTIIRMYKKDVSYNDLGLMGETVFGHVLTDLRRESKDTAADAVEEIMKKRTLVWNAQDIPYGSEQSWDSTAQEGVYYWTKHFGFNESAQKTIDSVLGYTPNVPHWGWNGNARRYWDFIYAGKLERFERQIHHYGSGLNSQVLLSAFRDDSSDSYLLRVGYAGSSAPLTNINQDGCPSTAFHSRPDTLKWDGYSSDYGGGLLGAVLNSGTYVAMDKQLGMVAFGGTISKVGAQYFVEPKDAVRKRIFIGPFNVMVTVDMGSIKSFNFIPGESNVQIELAQREGAHNVAKTAVWIESTSGEEWELDRARNLMGGAVTFEKGRGGWIVPLDRDVTLSISKRRTLM
ncbi:glycoside hydrolase family 43 [Fusarium sp. NRRL 52700]|nr:glycoside hydrolase family 43 [Fusarium sp. NRRL 52700]